MDAPGNGPEPPAEPPLEPSSEPPSDHSDSLERLVALLGVRLDDVRALAEEATSRWRGDRVRVGEGTRRRVRELAHELGLVTREEWDELELRVAQLEHRLRLLERSNDDAA